MTPNDIALVQASFEAVKPKAEALVKTFYDTLFEMAPQLRSMFPTDLSAQHKKLVSVLATAVGSLTKLDSLVPVLRDLGARHVGYGVKTEHYDVVGTALVTSLANTLAKDWSDETAEAWVAIYGVIKATMLEGAGSTAQAA